MNNDRIEKINAALEELFARTNIPREVKSAMYYSVSAGGKRIRPLLVLLFTRVFGGDEEKAMDYACALEMIHTYSLIHDDLPAMDNDDLRRGRPTCHAVYGEGMALLAGDGLLNFAYETLLAAALRDGEAGVRAAQAIAIGAGVTGMVAGQCMDLACERNGAEYPVTEIHKGKTGGLICAACLAGACIANAGAEHLSDVLTYGEQLGLAFQITDDILDVEGDEAALGKPIGSDVRNEKQTFVSLYGLEGAKRAAKAATDAALAALDKLPGDTTELEELTDALLKRDR